jgi:PAS domain S-box-containing protein
MERIQPSQALFKLVIESSPSGLILVNREGKIVLVNKQIENLFGYKREELIEQSIEVLLPQSFRAKHATYRAGFNQDPQTRSMGAGRDLFGLRKDGTQLPLEIGLNPLQTEDGPFVLAAIVDITERKNIERERLHLQHQVLEVAERERRRIGQDLHDSLGQKLLGIGFLAKVLNEDLVAKVPDQAAEAARIVQLLNEALAQTRQLAKDLYAAELQANDLPTALNQLTKNVQTTVRLECHFVHASLVACN